MAFALNTDIAARLGVTLTSAQEDQADAALDAATALVAAELDLTDAEAEALTPADLIKHVTITVALRIYANPSGASSESERLGDYQLSRGYSNGSTDLTSTERLLIRRAYYGASSGSSFPESNVDEVYDYLYS